MNRFFLLAAPGIAARPVVLVIAAWVVVIVLAATGGCARLWSHKPDQSAARQRSGAESQRDRLNDAYSFLYSTANGLSKVDKILYVKIESDDVQKVVDDASGYNGRLAKRLNGLKTDYPALDLHRQYESPIIKAALDAQKKGVLKRFAPVIGKSGKAFERGLLIRLLGGIQTEHYLAKTIAKREPDPALKKIMANAAQRYSKLYDEINALMKKRFYR